MASPVTDRPIDALWLSALRTSPLDKIAERLPAARRAEAVARTAEAAGAATGVLSGLPGAVTDMVLTADGRSLVTAHYGDHSVSVIDVATLAVTATATDIDEPYALAAADRVYASCAGITDDSVVAIDTAAGVELAAKTIPATARGLAVSPSGDTLYVARCIDDVADIAAIEVESGAVRIIPVAHAAGATLDTVRVNADGTRLYAALTTESGNALVVIDTRSHRVVQTVALTGSIGDIAVHRDGRRILVTGWDADRGGQVSVVDTASGRVVTIIPISGLPTQAVIADARAYVVHGDGDTAEVAVVDLVSARIMDRLDVGRPVSCVAVSRDGSRLYVAGYDGTVTASAVSPTGARLRPAS